MSDDDRTILPPEQRPPPGTGMGRPAAPAPERTIVLGAESDLVPPGTQLNHMYEIEEHVASGGMGEVYKGHELGTGDKVAIKIVLPERARDPSNLALFHKEASVLRRLAHGAIVRYLAFALDRGINRYFMAMEFVEGESLAQRLETKGPLTSEEARRLLARVASGLAEAHEAGIIHRDLSPDNIILLDGNVNKCKIIDFGIAKAGDIGGKTIIDGRLAGKLNFMSPEQLGLHGAVTEKSDIYSLGLVMVAALRGAALDMGETLGQAVEARRAVPDLSDIDPDLRPLLTAMLEPLPANRPASIADIAEWLRSSGGRRPALFGSGKSDPAIGGIPTSPLLPPQGQRGSQPPSFPPAGAQPDFGAAAGPPASFTTPPYRGSVPDPNAGPPIFSPPPGAAQRSFPPAPPSETFGYAGGPASQGSPSYYGDAQSTFYDPGTQGRGSQPPAGPPYPPQGTPSHSPFGPLPPGYGAEQPQGGGGLGFPPAAAMPPTPAPRRSRGGLVALLAIVVIAGWIGAGGYFGGFFDRMMKPAGDATQGGEGGKPSGGGAETDQGGESTQGGDGGRPAGGGGEAGKDQSGGAMQGEGGKPAGGDEAGKDQAADKTLDQAASLMETTQRTIKAFDGGPCFFAAVTSVSEKNVVVTGYGVEQPPFERLLEALRKATGIEPDVNLRLVDQPQCPAVDFLKAASDLTSSSPQLTLNRSLLALSEPLSGKAQVPDGAAVNLLYVDADGFVQGLDRLVKPGNPGERTFAFSLGNKKNAGGDQDSPRLIVLLTSPTGIDAAKISKAQRAEELFPKILDAAKAAGSDVGVAAAYFKIVTKS